MLIKELLSESFFQDIQALYHIFGCLGIMIDSNQHPETDEFKGLDKGTFGDAVVDRIHLKDMRRGIVFHIVQIIFVLPALEEGPIGPLLIGLCLLF